MRLFPPPLEIGDTEGFKPEKDIFGRAPLGSGLTNLLSSVTEPTVIAVDGQWGSGKTTFLKMWAGELRKAGFPVVYFDAFASDYLDDAFLAIAGEIIALVEEKKKAKTKVGKRLVESAVSTGKLLLRSGLKISVKAATLGAIAAADLEEVAGDLAAEASTLADKYLGELLTKQKQQKKTIQGFRDALSELPKLLASEIDDDDGKSEQPKPLIFIIDELDRCRPTFALEILERVKHFFAVPNVHFVLGVHLEQLRNSVVVAYGPNIDAGVYLQKFVHLVVYLIDSGHRRYERASRSPWTISAPHPLCADDAASSRCEQTAPRSGLGEDRRALGKVTTTKFLEYLKKTMEFSRQDQPILDRAIELIGYVANQRNLSLRTIERIMTTLAVALAYTSGDESRPGAIVGGLCVLKVLDPQLYAKAKKGTLRFDEVRDALRLEEVVDEDDRLRDWFINFWRYCTDEKPGEEIIQHFGSGSSRIQYRSRFDIVPDIANYVIDRLQPS